MGAGLGKGGQKLVLASWLSVISGLVEIDEQQWQQDKPTQLPCNSGFLGDFSAGERIPYPLLAIPKNAAVLLRLQRNKASHTPGFHEHPSLSKSPSLDNI